MTATARAIELTVAAAEAAADKLAEEIIALDVSDQLVITDAFLLAAANNPRQVRAVVDAVEEAMKAAGATLARREGVSDARWVLLDYADVVVHVQLAEDRYLMTVIATASNPRFSVRRVDVERGGPTYTVDTLTDLRAERPDAELFFITGADALAQILS
ncbi:MAG: ribosome silencing factor, partial [Geodermatophilaceae bacterium]